uniref:Uncharacterized protein n=1 Tax=Sipha flava TaxID=143950 RepID=A0A2S2QGY5_9HEMI
MPNFVYFHHIAYSTFGIILNAQAKLILCILPSGFWHFVHIFFGQNYYLRTNENRPFIKCTGISQNTGFSTFPIKAVIGGSRGPDPPRNFQKLKHFSGEYNLLIINCIK